jgi:tetratricopeptide (TPR) repeat protein
LIKKLAWTLPGGVIGALAGWFVGFGIIPGFLVGALFVYLLTSGIERSAGSLFGKIYNPSAVATPRRREYSRAESLKARGHYEQAIEAYEVALSEFPDDPEPYVRIARIYRDQLHEFDQALHWFTRARSDAIVDGPREVAIAREIIEVYENSLGMPKRAIPELARLADRFAGDEVGEWAKGEIGRLKSSVSDGGELVERE